MRRGSRGFSLVEFMVALAVSMVMLAAIVSIFLFSRQTFRMQDAGARIQENARFALAALEQDVRTAGYRGCVGDHPALRGDVFAATVNTLPDPGAFANNFGLGVQGFTGTGSGWLPALDASLAALDPPPDPDSDVLTVRAGAGAGIPVTATMANGADVVTVASAGGLQRGSRVLISNCVKAAVFAVSGVTGGTVLAHQSDLNASLDLGWAFGTDAFVMPATMTTYYVGATPAEAGMPGGRSLYRVRGGNPPEELVDGVAQMKVLFGEAPNGETDDGNLVAQRLAPPDAVAEPANVAAVRVQLLMQSADGDGAPSAQPYRFDGQFMLPADRRVRQAFQTTVSLRNRTK